MSVNKKEKWLAVEEKIGGDAGKRIVEALKELYSVFDPGIVDWYASLYDPEHGMWYHCRSAQENEPFLPDIESLSDTMGFLQEMGATGGKSCADWFPDWLKKRIFDFTYNLQDEDGYFYHPQWGKDIHNLRKSRDLGTCQRMIKTFGNVPPKYPIPGTQSSENGEYDLSKAPERFRSVENFKAYLASLDLKTRAYNWGSELSSQIGEIESFGKLHGENFLGMMMDTLIAHQREDNGIWHADLTYYGGNGAQKITKIFNWLGYKMPYADKGIESIMKIIMLDTQPGATVDVYNPWRALAEYIKNKERNGTPKEELDALMKNVYEWAPEAIRNNAKKIATFKQPGGGLSYSITGSCSTKCGSPCGVPGSKEGDVNGTSCGSSALIVSIYDALRLGTEYHVPVYGTEDMERFLKIVEKRERDYFGK